MKREVGDYIEDICNLFKVQNLCLRHILCLHQFLKLWLNTRCFTSKKPILLISKEWARQYIVLTTDSIFRPEGLDFSPSCFE